MKGRNYTNFKRKLVMMVIYLPVKFEFDWIRHFRVRVRKRNCWRTDKQTNERTELHQFRKEPTAQPVNFVTQWISSTAFHDNIKSFLHLIYIAELHINIRSHGCICLNTSIITVFEGLNGRWRNSLTEQYWSASEFCHPSEVRHLLQKCSRTSNIHILKSGILPWESKV